MMYILPFHLGCQHLVLPQGPSNQANQAPPNKGEVNERMDQTFRNTIKLQKEDFLAYRVLPSVLELHPLLEVQVGHPDQLLQALPATVTFSGIRKVALTETSMKVTC